MIGRFSWVHGDPGRLEEMVEFVRSTVLPNVDSLPGSYGLGLWVNRGDGSALALSVWAEPESLRASEEAVSAQRDQAAGLMAGTASVERLEAVLVDQAGPQQPGDVMRLIRMQSDPKDFDAHLDWARETIVPALRRMPGYLSYVVAADRASGLTLAMTTYRGREAADAAVAETAWVRDALADRKVEITAIAEFEVAVVGIHAPS